MTYEVNFEQPAGKWGVRHYRGNVSDEEVLDELWEECVGGYPLTADRRVAAEEDYRQRLKTLTPEDRYRIAVKIAEGRYSKEGSGL